jgi:deoxycytidine triphosphate deaminase
MGCHRTKCFISDELIIVAISTRSMVMDSGFNTHLRSLIMASTNFEMIPYKEIRIIPVVSEEINLSPPEHCGRRGRLPP